MLSSQSAGKKISEAKSEESSCQSDSTVAIEHTAKPKMSKKQKRQQKKRAQREAEQHKTAVKEAVSLSSPGNSKYKQQRDALISNLKSSIKECGILEVKVEHFIWESDLLARAGNLEESCKKNLLLVDEIFVLYKKALGKQRIILNLLINIERSQAAKTSEKEEDGETEEVIDINKLVKDIAYIDYTIENLDSFYIHHAALIAQKKLQDHEVKQAQEYALSGLKTLTKFITEGKKSHSEYMTDLIMNSEYRLKKVLLDTCYFALLKNNVKAANECFFAIVDFDITHLPGDNTFNILKDIVVKYGDTLASNGHYELAKQTIIYTHSFVEHFHERYNPETWEFDARYKKIYKENICRIFDAMILLSKIYRDYPQAKAGNNLLQVNFLKMALEIAPKSADEHFYIKECGFTEAYVRETFNLCENFIRPLVSELEAKDISLKQEEFEFKQPAKTRNDLYNEHKEVVANYPFNYFGWTNAVVLEAKQETLGRMFSLAQGMTELLTGEASSLLMLNYSDLDLTKAQYKSARKLIKLYGKLKALKAELEDWIEDLPISDLSEAHWREFIRERWNMFVTDNRDKFNKSDLIKFKEEKLEDLLKRNTSIFPEDETRVDQENAFECAWFEFVQDQWRKFVNYNKLDIFQEIIIQRDQEEENEYDMSLYQLLQDRIDILFAAVHKYQAAEAAANLYFQQNFFQPANLVSKKKGTNKDKSALSASIQTMSEEKKEEKEEEKAGENDKEYVLSKENLSEPTTENPVTNPVRPSIFRQTYREELKRLHAEYENIVSFYQEGIALLEEKRSPGAASARFISALDLGYSSKILANEKYGPMILADLMNAAIRFAQVKRMLAGNRVISFSKDPKIIAEQRKQAVECLSKLYTYLEVITHGANASHFSQAYKDNMIKAMVMLKLTQIESLSPVANRQEFNSEFDSVKQLVRTGASSDSKIVYPELAAKICCYQAYYLRNACSEYYTLKDYRQANPLIEEATALCEKALSLPVSDNDSEIMKWVLKDLLMYTDSIKMAIEKRLKAAEDYERFKASPFWKKGNPNNPTEKARYGRECFLERGELKQQMEKLTASVHVVQASLGKICANKGASHKIM